MKDSENANLLVYQLSPHHILKWKVMLDLCTVGLLDDRGQHLLPAAKRYIRIFLLIAFLPATILNQAFSEP